MSLTVVTPAASQRLASLHAARRSRGIASIVGVSMTISGPIGTKTITRNDGGSFLLDGFAAGNSVRLGSFPDAGNANTFTSTAVDHQTIAIDDPNSLSFNEGPAVADAWDPSQDEALGRGLDIATDFIVAYCGRRFVQEQVLEKVPGPDFVTTMLPLELRPLISIDAVLHDGDAVSGAEIDDAQAGIAYLGSGWGPNYASSQGGILSLPVPASRRSLWEITYTGGYITDNLVGTRDLPRDIEHWTIQLALALSSGASTGDLARATRDVASGITAKRIGDWSVSYAGASGGELEGRASLGALVEQALAGLQPYCKVSLA